MLDVADLDGIGEVLRSGIDLVIHMAASISVPESVASPGRYYCNNVSNSLGLAEACIEAKIPAVLFSSTAAVYGEPRTALVDEDHPLNPINPYGCSKAMAERVLQDVLGAAGIRLGIMRYFNVAGADPAGRFGPPAVAVAPNLFNSVCAVLAGDRTEFTLYGDDYPTEDGTCVRDFVHICDLVDAHLKLIDHLALGGESVLLNFGYGRGVSVRTVVNAAESLSGRRLPVRLVARRPGDAACVISNPRRFRDKFGQLEAHGTVRQMLEDTLRWYLHRSRRTVSLSEG
ncbi:MAG: UDP-glucose 4-epimerase GalE [Rhodanobacteraceae bacterium]|nr:UDP-glucose 4-epimerase GalE [Rhodanobacteraceae bacterium]